MRLSTRWLPFGSCTAARLRAAGLGDRDGPLGARTREEQSLKDLVSPGPLRASQSCKGGLPRWKRLRGSRILVLLPRATSTMPLPAPERRGRAWEVPPLRSGRLPPGLAAWTVSVELRVCVIPVTSATRRALGRRVVGADGARSGARLECTVPSGNFIFRKRAYETRKRLFEAGTVLHRSARTSLCRLVGAKDAWRLPLHARKPGSDHRSRTVANCNAATPMSLGPETNSIQPSEALPCYARR